MANQQKHNKTHIFPDTESSLAKEWLELSDEELNEKFRAALPASFCGRRTAPAVNEKLVGGEKRQDYYCRTCLAIFKRRRTSG